ncbi:catalase [Duganella sp. FT3S]|uniref:Catalase n=1 Tax=Rugamonas fusca TaxID=2758568 RepID=A0A7W2EM27_9BURK|nr:putative metalloprotease CJM1_0395 family protein [Rugamonas fusca]MBA5608386.1 catalase [Rugamonas fusca]
MSTAAIPASASATPPVALPGAPNAAGPQAHGDARAGAPGDRAADGRTSSTSASTTTSSSTTLTPQALALIDRLKTRDTEVRQHEQAHLAAAGGLAVSGAAYTYQRGPNGVDYAIGGEVHIDTSPGRTPGETITRARTIEAAALAPADPSGPDRAVAAQAQQMEQQARAELAVEAAQQARAAREPEASPRLTRGAGQDNGATPAPAPTAQAPAAQVQGAAPAVSAPATGRPLVPGIADGAQVAPLQQPPSAASLRRAYDIAPQALPRLDIVA